MITLKYVPNSSNGNFIQHKFRTEMDLRIWLVRNIPDDKTKIFLLTYHKDTGRDLTTDEFFITQNLESALTFLKVFTDMQNTKNFHVIFEEHYSFEDAYINARQ